MHWLRPSILLCLFSMAATVAATPATAAAAATPTATDSTGPPPPPRPAPAPPSSTAAMLRPRHVRRLHRRRYRHHASEADLRAAVRRELRGLRLGCWCEQARSPTPTSTTTPTAPPSSRPHSVLSMLIDMHTLLALFVLTQQMHTDMGDERGIRLRCICLGRAAPRGSRMRGMGRCGKGSESRIARSSLSRSLVLVCALRLGVCVLTSPFTK